jgi:hypothetical protein
MTTAGKEVQMTHLRLKRPQRPPAPFRAGLATLVAGALLELGAHTGLLPAAGAWAEDTGHLIILLGMLLTLTGVLRIARAAGRRPAPAVNREHKRRQ